MKRKSGFTLIEILVAITVFAIGVLAVLRMITQNLATLDTTRLRTTATFLAKEGIALVYNLRDANLQKSLPRDCVLVSDLTTGDRNDIDPDEVCERNFSSGASDQKLLQISFSPAGYLSVQTVDADTDFDDLWNDNLLHFATGTIAGHLLFRYSSTPTADSAPTFFARYLRFSAVQESSSSLPADYILKLESHVLYKKGSKTGEVVLESFIGKY